MRKAFSFLLLLLSLTAGAQHRQYVFDFTEPGKLDGPVIQQSPSDVKVLVVDSVFRSDDGHMQLSFQLGDTPGGSFMYFYQEQPSFLAIEPPVRFLVDAIGAVITEIRISEDSRCGDLNILSPNVPEGYYDYFGHYWSGEQSQVRNVTFVNMGSPTLLYQLIIDYDIDRDVLAPTAAMLNDVTYAEGAEVYDFASLKLQFGQQVKLGNEAAFTLHCPDNTTLPLDGVFNNNMLTLSLPANVQQPTELGEYTIEVAVQSVVTDDEVEQYNKTLTYKFNKIQNCATFEYATVTPSTEGTIDVLPNQFSLTFPSYARIMANALPLTIIRMSDGSPERQVTARLDDTDYKKVIFDFQSDMPADISQKDVYILEVPEGYFWNNAYKPEAADQGRADGARYNPAFTLAWNVGGVKFVSDEMLAKATEWMGHTGVGYPTATSTARSALAALIANHNDKDDADMQAAIDAFLAETDVMLPENKVYYEIAAKNSEGTLLYLSFDDANGIGLTTDETGAARFRAETKDGGMAFKINGNKYLHQLVKNDDYTGTSAYGVTNEYTPLLNDLTLARADVADAVEGTFGLLSIYGCMGHNDDEAEVYEYAYIDFNTQRINTSESHNKNQYFDDRRSTAFQFVEVEAPEISVAYELSPADGSETLSLNQITVTFPTLDAVTLVDKNVISLTGATSYTPVTVTAVSGKTNAYNLNFTGVMPTGNYTLTIGKGAFSYQLDDEVRTVQAITAQYTLNELQFVYDFMSMVYFYEGYNAWDPIAPEDVNHWTYWNEGSFGAKDTDVVIIERNRRNRVHVHGKFVVNNKFVNEFGAKLKAVQFKPDHTITDADLPTGNYQMMIPAESFGDGNYAKYLANPSSIAKNQCHVNAEYVKDFCVVDLVTGINITLDDDAQPKEVFDLQGRRVEGKAKPGMYIVNGRKVIIK